MISVPTSSPLNVDGFLGKFEDIIVTWSPVPVNHQRGVIQGYHIVYVAQPSGIQQKLTVTANKTRVELQNLKIYTLYTIAVAAFTVAGQGPSSPEVEVRSAESGKRRPIV